jgi:hypothetical protein
MRVPISITTLMLAFEALVAPAPAAKKQDNLYKEI